ncbi:hypothetical protein E3N88_38687 [Mikania micrantha]|uniref:Uncharacterized protein n=1 Tax=Mikania micrantha TaxID=192012 RepID=A0A5N6LUY8_9ASTR|nr:hypothetical protein E3N88_38687 [Mikania micrantha]
MEIKGGIDPEAPLDFVELHIFPSQNRYEAYVCSNNRAVKAASGTLKQLLLHSPRVKELSTKGSNMNFKILPPDSFNDWFTTATLTRFLHILGLPDFLSIGNEITQLEETRKFQLSLSLKAVVDITSSIDSKNELLRAVDLRLTELKDEVVAAIDQVTGARSSTKDISDLESFAHHLGTKDIRDLLQKFVEMNLFPTVEDSKKCNKYGGSPKVAQTEPSVDRCHAAKKSATPRRSVSPLRRIQIGRSGSHRAPSLTIKSLNHFPTRENISFLRCPTASSSDDDDNDPYKPAKKNVLRMSVQDKISLFESKQRDQKVDIPKTKKLLNTTIGPNKAVLRRWSSGMGENATQKPENIEPDPEPKPNPKPEPLSDSFKCESRGSNVAAENIKPHSPEREESCEKHPDSIEWSQQNEAKLNELFLKMMENKNKPAHHGNLNSGITKSKKSTVLKDDKGGSYDQNKQKKDEKIRVETFGNKSEKKTEVVQKKRTQKNLTPLMNSRKEPLKPSVLKKTASKPSSVPDTHKSWSSTPSPRTPTGPASAGTTPTSRKPVGSKTKSMKTQPQSMALKATPPDANRNLKSIKKLQSTTKSTKTTKTNVDQTPEVEPSFYNKVTKKSSVVPLETKPFLRKGSGIESSVGPVVIKSKAVDQPEETSRTSGTLNHTEDNELVMAIDKSENEKKCEIQVVSPSLSTNLSLSPSPTKCEKPKSFNVELPDQPEETSRTFGTLNHTEDNEVVTANDISENEKICENQVVGPSLSTSLSSSPTKCEKSKSFNVELSELINVNKEVEDELAINHEEEMIPCLVQTESPVQAVASAGTSSSPRVRHSLSQMLQQESNEETDVSEWGNAEHPPLLVYQKDSPKGFKRLLKFARKSKAEPALSEGDDVDEDSRVISHNQLKVPEGHVSASLNMSKGRVSMKCYKRVG